jgi:hypothetical protein
MTFKNRETFEEMVDRVAGSALQKLLVGTQFRSIIWMVCEQTAMWREREDRFIAESAKKGS